MTKPPAKPKAAPAKKPAAPKAAKPKTAKPAAPKKPPALKAQLIKIEPNKKTYAGFVAILGAPNAGKSTLLNQLIGQKVSIVSPKAQTTRIRTLGILSEDDTQISFIDTPGIFAAKSRLDQAMVRSAWSSLQDADATILMIDSVTHKEDEKIAAIVAELRKRKKSVILILNKSDALPPAQLLPLAQKWNEAGIFSDIFMISALKGHGVDDLKKHLKKLMPESPWYYGEDQVSDLPSQILAAEMTREQLYRQLQEELPYAAAVLPSELEEKRDGSVIIRQIIVVAREGHRAIVLGHQGSRIKTIGEKARADIGRLFGRKVHLFLEVKVDERWQDRPDFYRTFGLDFGKK